MAIYTCESMSILQFLTASHMKPPRQLPEILVRCAIQLSPQVTVRLAASDDHNLGEHWCVAAFLPALPALPAATVGAPLLGSCSAKGSRRLCLDHQTPSRWCLGLERKFPALTPPTHRCGCAPLCPPSLTLHVRFEHCALLPVFLCGGGICPHVRPSRACETPIASAPQHCRG